jgi:D-methionine transport system ATP-binding protein
MIEFINVKKEFSGVKALDNVTFTIPSSCIFGIVGKSGAGKSTLLRTINRLENIDAGQILIDGVDVTKLDGKALRLLRKNIGMIFQHFSLLETKDVFHNIALPLQTSGYKKEQIKEKVNSPLLD